MDRRLTISPSGIIRYCILLAITLWVWSFFRSYFLFLALILVVCCPVISFLLLWFHRDALRVQMLLPPNRVGRSTDFLFDISAYNPGRAAAFTADITYSWSNLFTGYSEQRKQHLWIPPGGSRISQLLSSRYVGRVEVRIENFAVYDLFHLFCLRGCDKEDAHVVVWPAFSEVSEEEIRSCVADFPEEYELKKRGTDYNPDYEVREYIPGDELKNIHWKLSAKKEELMVRERLSQGREKINILLPLTEDRQLNDGLMESVYALGRLLIDKEYPIHVYWPGRGSALQGFFVSELGEFDGVISEILSDSGLHRPEDAETRMAEEHPTESYILVRTGAYKGAYIR